MPEQTTVTVPIGLNEGPAQPAQPQERPSSGFVNNQYVPPTERVSLHKTRLGAALVKRTEQAAPAPVPQQSAPASDAISQQINQLTNTVALLAANQLSNAPRGYDAPDRDAAALNKLLLHNRYGSGPYVEDTGSQPQWGGPDPDRFDFFDEQDTSDFYRLTNDHVERTVQQRLDAERTAQQKTAEGEMLHRQLDAAEAKFKRDVNYTETMQAAIHRSAESGWKLPLEQSYLQISNETEARSGQRRSSYLPKDVKTLGAIMRYNLETGRSKPVR